MGCNTKRGRILSVSLGGGCVWTTGLAIGPLVFTSFVLFEGRVYFFVFLCTSTSSVVQLVTPVSICQRHP